MEGVEWAVSTVLWGSWMAKWSMDDVVGWETGLKEGGRWCVRHRKLCSVDWRVRPFAVGVSHCVWRSPPRMVVAWGNGAVNVAM